MAIRRATYDDLAAIRLLPVQLTGRPSWGILHKHYRVLVLEARTRVLIYQRKEEVKGFMALRKLEHGNCLAIVHLGLRKPTGKNTVAQQLAKQAELRAAELDCAGLVVALDGLSKEALSYYVKEGFKKSGDKLIKKLAV